jgi:D-alanyl-D-alanine carboxypeptidase
MQKKILYSILLIFFVCSASAQNRQKQLTKSIDSLLYTLVSNKKAAGVSYAIQLKNGKKHFYSAGVRNITTQKKLSKNNCFRIASITKTFTAIAIMILVEEGKINLDTRLSNFFPSFPKADEITIYQLLAHTSGIPNWWEGQMPKDEPKDFPMCPMPHFYIERMKTTSFFKPGSKYYYSNTGYVLLGEIISMITQKNYISFLKEHIFDKLKMKNTTMEFVGGTNINWVDGYTKASDTASLFLNPAVYAMPFAAGGLRSNTSDMLTFIKGIYDGKLISQNALKYITSYAKTNDSLNIYDALYFPNNFTPPPPPQHIKKYGYGLGFSLMEIYNTPVVWHSGGIAGFNSIMQYRKWTNAHLGTITKIGSCFLN